MDGDGEARIPASSFMSLAHIVRRSRQLRGASLALHDDERATTWTEFADRIARLAAGLQAIGLQANDRVAILADNSARFIEAYFATPWAGGVFTPLNHRLSASEIAAILHDSGARILIVDTTFSPLVDELATLAPLDRIILAATGAPTQPGWLGYERLVADHAPAPDAGRRGEDIAALFYTSGSTGQPKGVMHSHANILAAGYGVIPAYGLDEDSVALVSGPLFHVGAMGLAIPTLMAAGALTILPRFDAARALERIEQRQVTITSAVPTMLRIMLDHPDCPRRDLSSLEKVPFGGAPMPPALLTQLLEVMPKARFLHSYGMTETVSSCSSLPDIWLRPERAARGKTNSIGRALLGVELSIRDANDQDVAPGIVGEIVVRGACVMQGYWNKPEATAQTLRGGWLHTGDLGALDADGFLYIVDRLKDMIITGGENVYSTEVEDTIYAFPGVSQCAVIGIPDERWGEAVHAIVAPREGAAIDATALLAHCRERIARYKCPRSFDIRREPLPLSGANKINKPVLRAPFWSGRTGALV